MIQPTQAQIEAARKLLQLSSCFGKEVCVMLPCACAETLTAAAQVGEQVTEEYLEAAIARRTKLNKVVYEEAVADTIERCAQVAEEYKANDPETVRNINYRLDIAAAIRQLKDAP